MYMYMKLQFGCFGIPLLWVSNMIHVHYIMRTLPIMLQHIVMFNYIVSCCFGSLFGTITKIGWEFEAVCGISFRRVGDFPCLPLHPSVYTSALASVHVLLNIVSRESPSSFVVRNLGTLAITQRQF